MKYGINTLMFAATFTDEDTHLFGQMKDLGFDVVEIALEKKSDLDYGRTVKELEKYDIVCSSICGLFGEDRDIRGPNQEYVEIGKAYIRDLIDAAAALGVEQVNGPLYSAVGRSNLEPADAKKQQWETCKNSLKELCEYADKKDVYLALEPLNRFETDFINICSQAKQMVDEVGSDRLGIHLDTFHMGIEEKSSANAIRLAGDKLFMIHACENDRGAAGTGQVHWQEISEACREIGYDRYVVIEAFTPDMEVIAKAASVWRETEPDAATLARKAINFLRKTF